MVRRKGRKEKCLSGSEESVRRKRLSQAGGEGNSRPSRPIRSLSFCWQFLCLDLPCASHKGGGIEPFRIPRRHEAPSRSSPSTCSESRGAHRCSSVCVSWVPRMVWVVEGLTMSRRTAAWFEMSRAAAAARGPAACAAAAPDVSTAGS